MFAIQKTLLKNIDQETELILINQYDLESFIRGYHAYLDIRLYPKMLMKIFVWSQKMKISMTSFQLLVCWKNK